MDTNESLIKFPCKLPVKVIGNFSEGFLDEIYNLVYPFDRTLKKEEIQQKVGKNNNYLSLTLNIMARNKVQLDNIYRVLHYNSRVKFVL